jgi:DNA-binding NarL/FixJ family response regulator
LLTNGLSNGQIASRLSISRKTTEHHVSAIIARLGVASRGEAAALARTKGLPGD